MNSTTRCTFKEGSFFASTRRASSFLIITGALWHLQLLFQWLLIMLRTARHFPQCVVPMNANDVYGVLSKMALLALWRICGGLASKASVLWRRVCLFTSAICLLFPLPVNTINTARGTERAPNILSNTKASCLESWQWWMLQRFQSKLLFS